MTITHKQLANLLPADGKLTVSHEIFWTAWTALIDGPDPISQYVYRGHFVRSGMGGLDLLTDLTEVQRARLATKLDEPEKVRLFALYLENIPTHGSSLLRDPSVGFNALARETNLTETLELMAEQLKDLPLTRRMVGSKPTPETGGGAKTVGAAGNSGATGIPRWATRRTRSGHSSRGSSGESQSRRRPRHPGNGSWRNLTRRLKDTKSFTKYHLSRRTTTTKGSPVG